MKNTLIEKHRAYAVPLSNHDTKLYYDGFSNKTIWPLFHYFPFFTSYDDESWRAYINVNTKFNETLAGIYEPGDIIWVHDYHLMLLPGIIRQNIPDAKIGFFLHIRSVIRGLPSYAMEEGKY